MVSTRKDRYTSTRPQQTYTTVILTPNFAKRWTTGGKLQGNLAESLGVAPLIAPHPTDLTSKLIISKDISKDTLSTSDQSNLQSPLRKNFKLAIRALPGSHESKEDSRVTSHDNYTSAQSPGLPASNHPERRTAFNSTQNQTPVLQDKAECASAGQVFNGFGLSREALTVLLDLLRSATIQTLVFLFCLASGASYRVVSRAFDMPRSTVHRIVLRVADEVLAIHQEIHLPKTPEHLET
ncbi:uncharacterized protein LOC131537724 [Onychostoma macrolepis]|uniref:uncharacterized protein LOC131537724 n=1 Tax=Onychostoma macrolepis TaxID=369639 RepID=UPI00272CBFB7|nr:uncharacterized protein LOC131537724 [Onychostoma macrolepis]